MNANELKTLLTALSAGEISVAEGLEKLRTLPFEDIGVAMIDHHRELRQGVPEVVLGESKSAGQVFSIVECMAERGRNILVTRLGADKVEPLLTRFPDGEYDPDARTFCLVQKPIEPLGAGKVLVVCAGTSDLPVAREAAVTARMLGNEVDELVDVGVAGIHRLFARADRLREATVVIVVAGMEGALPSVIGGLVSVPVIAVPTSVGYGAAFGGVAALLGMLNSCASGVTVVNIDNGFGAAFAASRINRLGGPKP
ncbi:1-(5-phosphoribosyl)-5-amino-4-imidazole-carboxyl ate carboxylase [Desulfuromonas versatilis]|uniref:1-(5-phosphoribosyl)-5-amino-4-imidazole-carboxyl ate carboxylase n=1 Tax=Desulfuromonas versatilis TaxID=2802975 RepID=A0ABM8HZF0_9BACT|nr:nickel pincer cofactor biosynthesis protein LarB [Desulfuromonas versatilis]BCR06161.1 1-(5-phosphoribosyl)-5-amino-4-imidazole-carboxyl ate carboxylase [Desulfuromonas versatilis]